MILANDSVEPTSNAVLTEALHACESHAEAIFHRLVHEDRATERQYLTRRIRELLEFAAQLEQRIKAELPCVWIDEIAMHNHRQNAGGGRTSSTVRGRARTPHSVPCRSKSVFSVLRDVGQTV